MKKIYAFLFSITLTHVIYSQKFLCTFILSSCLTIYAATAFAQQIPYYIPTDSLVAWYPFNNNANDESGNGYNGEANDSTVITTDRCEIPNSAYYFNGQTSQITIPDALFNGGWYSHTICCWLNSDTVINPYSNANNQCIINTLPHRGEEICFSYFGSGKFNFFAGSDPPAAVWDMFSFAPSQTYVTAHTWNHIAMVKEGTSYSLYVNGALDTIFQTNIEAVDYYCSLVIGNISQYAIETFFGKLDDFGIWKRALTAAEILEIYNAGCNPISIACSQTNVCEKFCTSFTDQSSNNPTSWQWLFEGGSPPSSTDQNPENICYDDPGIFDVTLITTNAAGNDTLVLTNFITVYTNPFAPTITQNGNVVTCSDATSYQWYLNTVLIPGATDQTYTITESGLYTVVIGNENGCEAQADFDAVWIGIEDLNSNFSFNIFPNPAFDQITLSGSNFKISELKIVNLLGQEIFSSEIKMNGEKTFTINIESLPAGIYKVMVMSEVGIHQTSFVKE